MVGPFGEMVTVSVKKRNVIIQFHRMTSFRFLLEICRFLCCHSVLFPCYRFYSRGAKCEKNLLLYILRTTIDFVIETRVSTCQKSEIRI